MNEALCMCVLECEDNRSENFPHVRLTQCFERKERLKGTVCPIFDEVDVAALDYHLLYRIDTRVQQILDGCQLLNDLPSRLFLHFVTFDFHIYGIFLYQILFRESDLFFNWRLNVDYHRRRVPRQLRQRPVSRHRWQRGQSDFRNFPLSYEHRNLFLLDALDRDTWY